MTYSLRQFPSSYPYLWQPYSKATAIVIQYTHAGVGGHASGGSPYVGLRRTVLIWTKQAGSNAFKALHQRLSTWQDMSRQHRLAQRTVVAQLECIAAVQASSKICWRISKTMYWHYSHSRTSQKRYTGFAFAFSPHTRDKPREYK